MRKIGEIVDAKIKDLAFDGKAIGDIDGKIIFLNGGLPGETVRARITKSRPRFDAAKVLQIIEKAPERIDAPCRHFDICGGCTWQDLEYERQLYYKRKQVVDCIKHIGKMDDVEITDIIGAPEQFRYRNKMEFSFHVAPEDGFVLGLHHRGEFDKIFNLEECLLQSDTANKIVLWLSEYIKTNRIPVYDLIEHTGYIRFLIIRETANTGQIMVNIVTSNGKFPDAQKFISEFTAAFPEITTVAHNINSQKANIAKGEQETILFGPGCIEEILLGKKFRIYANSFFQTNSRQAEKLYQTAFELLNPEPTDRLLDLYCGTGTIGLCASDRVERVVGVEIEESAVTAAKENAVINNVENAEYICGSAQDLMKTDPELFSGLNCAIIDPPRAGLHKKALKGLIDFGYPRLVYISCNPATFARDAAIMRENGYNIGRVIPVDMFPHTMHIELAADFTKG